MKNMFPKLFATRAAIRRASRSFTSFLRELALTGEIQLLSTYVAPVTYWYAPKGKHATGEYSEDPEEIIKTLGGSGVWVTFIWQGETYKVYFSHPDFLEQDEFGVFGEYFKQFVQNLKDSGEYYYPATSIEWWRVPGPGEPPALIGDATTHYLGEASKLLPIERRGGFWVSGPHIYCEDKGNLKVLPMIELTDEIKIKFFNNYILVGENQVVVKGDPGKILEVENPQDIEDGAVSPYSFKMNDCGELYYIPRRSLTELIVFYENNQFAKSAAAMRQRQEAAAATELARRQREEAAEMRRLHETAELDNFVRGESTLLIEVVFHQRSGDSTPSGSKILHPDNTERGRYYDDTPVCQYLYGFQEKGWPGRAERGMLINIPVAKRAMRNGILYIDVPKFAMGKIIGTRGANIRATEEALRRKGLPGLRAIRLRPKD